MFTLIYEKKIKEYLCKRIMSLKCQIILGHIGLEGEILGVGWIGEREKSSYGDC